MTSEPARSRLDAGAAADWPWSSQPGTLAEPGVLVEARAGGESDYSCDQLLPERSKCPVQCRSGVRAAGEAP